MRRRRFWFSAAQIERKVSSAVGKLIVLNDSYPDDEAMLGLIDQYKAALRDAGLTPPQKDEEEEDAGDSTRAAIPLS